MRFCRAERIEAAIPDYTQSMHGVARVLIGIGALLMIAGLAALLAEKAGLPLGKLPGDFAWRGKHSSVYFPLATSLLLSAFLSLIFYFIGWLRR